MNNIKDQENINQKVILLRLDLNVPLKNGVITDQTRIDKILPVINFLIKKNCKIVIISHVGRPKGKVNKELSLKPICENLESKINQKIKLINENIFKIKKDKLFKNFDGQIIFLENIRFYEEEEKNDTNFSKQLDDLEAITLAERLRKLKRTEQKLSQKLVSLMPSSIGRMTTQLKNENRVSVYEMEKIQTTVSLDAEEIKNEISRYHERTNKAEYGEVSRLMNQAKAKEELGVVAQSLRNNISFQALNGLNQWEQLFELWAKLLQVDSPSGDSSGGNAVGKDKTADILALLKIRKIQSEILFKTKNLDRQGFRGNKEKWASSLTNQQDTLMIDLTDTQISMAEEAMNPLFDDAHMAMAKSSEQLSNQVFDEVTQSAQEESKEILSDLINLLIEGQGKGNQPNASENLTAMELLMMQMANQKPGQAKGKSPMAGKSGGGSSQGGTTDKTINSLNGNTSTPTNIGTSSQSSGSGGPSIAPEFQEVMEKYFKAIED